MQQKIKPVGSGIGKQNGVVIEIIANDNLLDRCDFGYKIYDVDGNQVGEGNIPMLDKDYSDWNSANDTAVIFVLTKLNLSKA